MKNRHRTNTVLLLTETSCPAETCWSPRADIYRGTYGWLIKFDLAGVRPEDISVSFDGAQLSVHGTRRDCFVEADYSSYSIEISYSYFARTIELPGATKSMRVTTDYHDGMLLVKVTT